eukprot:43416-Ditylum_brightwellii.AAC.1
MKRGRKLNFQKARKRAQQGGKATRVITSTTLHGDGKVTIVTETVQEEEEEDYHEVESVLQHDDINTSA